MDLRFVAPRLRFLDGVGSEVLACCMFSDQRPVQGVAGLVDWRMGARLTRWLESGALTGESGEVALVPGKPRIPFEKLLLFGLGPVGAFNEESFERAVQQMLTTLSALRVRMAVVERPGRHLGVVDAQRAIEIVLQACSAHEDQDAWTLVEDLIDQKQIAKHLAAERHRKRLR